MGRHAHLYLTEDNAKEKVDAWLRDVRLEVAPRPHLRLEPLRCALLLIDLNAYFVHPEGECYLPASRVALLRAEALLQAWRQNRGCVVHLRHAHKGVHDLGMFGRFYRSHILEADPQSRLLLQPAPGEEVFRKVTYDAFLDTPLQAHLRAHGVDQVLITGVQTHLCCDTTARAAFCRNFEVYFAADATACVSERLHVGTLLALASGVAVIKSTEEILTLCSLNGSPSSEQGLLG